MVCGVTKSRKPLKRRSTRVYLALRDSPQTLSSAEEEMQNECKVLLDSQGIKCR